MARQMTEIAFRMRRIGNRAELLLKLAFRRNARREEAANGIRRGSAAGKFQRK